MFSQFMFKISKSKFMLDKLLSVRLEIEFLLFLKIYYIVMSHIINMNNLNIFPL